MLDLEGKTVKQIIHTPKPPYAAFDTEDESRLQIWAEAARLVLIEVAIKGETINYQKLWNELLTRDAGPAPRGLWRRRTSSLLYRVAKLNRLNEEPMLSALVILKETGEVSEGYEDGVQARYGYTPYSIAHHARTERLKIARWLGV